MNVTKITIGRLYNLGSYEHVRYEISVEVKEGESAATAMLGLEKILSELNPRTSTNSRQELAREFHRITELRNELSLPEDEFRRKHGHFVGTPFDYVKRVQESHDQNVAKRYAWERRQSKARKMLEDLGGAANWRDAKLDWETDDDCY